MAFYESRFDLSASRIEISKNKGFRDFPEHLHRQVELQYFFSDKVDFRVDGSDIECRDGLLFIFPFQVHSNRQLKKCRHFSAIITPDLFSPYADILLGERPLDPFVPKDALPAFTEELFEHAYSLDADGTDPRRGQIINDIFSLIIGEALRVIKTTKRGSMSANGSIPTLTRVIDYCVTHLSDELSLDSVAGALFLDKFYISKLFATKAQMSFVDFINSQRVFNACQALTGSSKPITEIAYECGFRNQSTFNRVFREQTGVTPREFRRNGRYL